MINFHKLPPPPPSYVTRGCHTVGVKMKRRWYSFKQKNGIFSLHFRHVESVTNLPLPRKRRGEGGREGGGGESFIKRRIAKNLKRNRNRNWETETAQHVPLSGWWETGGRWTHGDFLPLRHPPSSPGATSSPNHRTNVISFLISYPINTSIPKCFTRASWGKFQLIHWCWSMQQKRISSW